MVTAKPKVFPKIVPPLDCNQRNGKELINLLLSPFLSFFSLLEAGAPSTSPLPENEIPRSVLDPLQRGGSPKPPLLFFECVYARSTYGRSFKIFSACS